MITLLNTSILTTYGDYDYTPISLKDARQMLKSEPFQSAVGHAATADIMSILLDTRVKLNRINYQQEIGDIAIVFKLKSRLEEGKILTVNEIEEIGYEWGLLVKKDANIVPYDSEADTLNHIKRVNELLGKAACILIMRGNIHDESKLGSPEKELFDKYTPILKTLTYGSPEYKESLEKLKPALDHHYANNSHHPEYTFFDEKWKDIKGYEGIYQISNKGRVKRLESIVKREKQGDFKKKESILTPHVTPKGYLRIQLSKGGKSKNIFVHTLVASEFFKPVKGKTQVNHKDGNKLNNYKDNLEYVSGSENLIHAYNTGLRESNAKYVVHCIELDITTIGTVKMEKELRAKGYERASSSAIYRCITSDNENHAHLDLHFESYNINDYPLLNSPVDGMNLFDIIEMLIDWKAATERTQDGDIMKSIYINEERFKISPQLAQIFRNTVIEMGWDKK